MSRRLPWLFLVAGLVACGPAAPGDLPPDAGPGPVPETRPLDWRELPEERLAVTCRPLIGATFHSVDPAAPQRWRAEASNVLLRSDDEGHTWTRAPVDTAVGLVAAGPVVVAYANTEPLRTGFAEWSASADTGATWAPLTLAPTADPALPPGSLAGTVGAVRVAWTPTSRVHYSLDQGQTWRSEPDAVLPSFGDAWHSALDAREWYADPGENAIYASRDTGRTWVTKRWFAAQDVKLLGAEGVVVTTSEGGLMLSRDDGATWLVLPGLSGQLAVGPADGELWVLSKPVAPEAPRLMHSLDWGESFAPVRLDLGPAGAVTAAAPRARAWALADGRRVLNVELPGLETLSPRMLCTETSGPGALEQPTPQRSDVPGVVTLWAGNGRGQALGSTQQVVPLAEPGRAYWLAQRAFTDAVSLNGGTRTASGTVALLYQPVPVLSPRVGPPMFVRELEPVGLTPTVITKFDNLLELGGSGQGKYLESHTLQALPDGTFRTDTEEGDFPLGGPTAMWAPWPKGSHWGRYGTGAAVVTKEFVGATQYFRWSRSLVEAGEFCDVATIPTERCVSYPGHVVDFAHRQGRLYVLDDWRGEVLEADFANRDNAWRVVVTGLARPTSLFMPLDDDPGLYVVDTHLYRFVPGPLASGRRP